MLPKASLKTSCRMAAGYAFLTQPGRGTVYDHERLAKAFAPLLAFTLLLAFELLPGLFRRRHAAVDDYALGEPDRRLRIWIAADDVLGVKQAVAGGILDAPCLARRRPFDLGPHLLADDEVVGDGVNAVHFDHAVAPQVSHFHFPLLFPSPPLALEACNRANPNKSAT
jgi:hypothetical protein